MPHHNSVFHSVLKHVPWDELDRAVERHGAADRARGFGYKSQFVAMLYAQLSGASSLREVEAGLQSHASRLYHLGACPARRSSLADANRDRPAAVFSDLLAAMVQRAHRGLRRALDGATLLVDSTGLRLNGHSANWARFSARVCGAKLHVVYDPDADRPVYAAVSTARTTDLTAAKAMPVEPGATYVFDLGYYDYAWWAELDAAGCTIVTRLKCNTPLRVTETRPVPPEAGGAEAAGQAKGGGAVLSDRVGLLPARLAQSRSNPYGKPVREVQVRISTGKVLRVVTNDLQAPAQQVADLYKRRWAIELFFRWVKQTLRITRFLGTSENAVRTQVAAALVAFLLLRMAQATQAATQAATSSPLLFARLVRANLMHLRRLGELHRPPSQPTTAPGQGTLAL